MQRKINRVGPNTLTVSLPAKIAKRFNLKKGDEVDLEEQANGILINFGIRSAEEVGKLHFDKPSEFRGRYLIRLYNQGYDTIEISSDEPLPFDKIKYSLSEMLGFEIVKQSAKFCVIKNVAKPVDSEFENIFRQLFFFISAMGKTSLDAVSHRNNQLLAETLNLDITANKLVNFCARVLNQRNQTNSSHLFYVSQELEHIADNYTDICEFCINNDVRLTSQMGKFYQDVINHFDAVHSVFYDFSKEKMVELIAIKDKLVKKGVELIEKSSGRQAVVVHYLSEIVGRLNHIECAIVYAEPVQL